MNVFYILKKISASFCSRDEKAKQGKEREKEREK